MEFAKIGANSRPSREKHLSIMPICRKLLGLSQPMGNGLKLYLMLVLSCKTFYIIVYIIVLNYFNTTNTTNLLRCHNEDVVPHL